MIKFAGEDKDSKGPVLGIGLSRENCERMLAGAPILFSTEGMPGLPVMQVFITAGESDQGMAMEFIRTGAVDDIREDRSLADPNIRPADKGEVN